MYQPSKSPFPFAVPRTGALITDERCKCGSLRSEHRNTVSFGHGPRVVGDVVTCERFTWVNHVFTSHLIRGRVALDDTFAVEVTRASDRSVGAKGWRIQVYDMSRRGGGAKAFNTIAIQDANGKMVRTKADAVAFAKVELQRYLDRQNTQTTLGGVS